MRLVVTGFTGPYTLPPDISSQTDHIVHICAGSGSVAEFLDAEVRAGQHLRHFGTPSSTRTRRGTTSSIRDALARKTSPLAIPTGCRWFHTLTREETRRRVGPYEVRRGGGSAALLAAKSFPIRRHLSSMSGGPGAYRNLTSWGGRPERMDQAAAAFLEGVLAELKTLGVPPSRISASSTADRRGISREPRPRRSRARVVKLRQPIIAA